MISLLFIIFVCLYVAAFWKSEADTIQFRPRQAISKSDWWLGKRGINGRNWLMKYPLAAFWDGWHFCIAMMLGCFFLAIGTLFIYIVHISFWWLLPFVLGSFLVFGLFFNLQYDDNLKDML
jgi:hypothetical protein